MKVNRRNKPKNKANQASLRDISKKEKLRRILFHLELIAKIKSPILRRRVLEHFAHDKGMFDALSETCLNVTEDNLQFSSGSKKKLRKYKQCILDLATRKADKKKLMVGSGVFLPLLIPAAISAISEILSRR